MNKFEIVKVMTESNQALINELIKVQADESKMISECIRRTQAGDKEGYKLLSFDNTSKLIDRLQTAIRKHHEEIDQLARKVYNEGE